MSPFRKTARDSRIPAILLTPVYLHPAAVAPRTHCRKHPFNASGEDFVLDSDDGEARQGTLLLMVHLSRIERPFGPEPMHFLRSLSLPIKPSLVFCRLMSASVLINGVSVPVTASCDCDLEEVLRSPNFFNWTKKVDSGLLVKSIDVQSVDMFGNGRIGFIKFKSLVYKSSFPNGRHIPGIVFMRGPSVGILLVLNCNGKKYTILTCQPRFPIADSAFTEIPAGVFDGEVFSGVAAKELKEEVGITIRAESLVDMTEQVYGGRYPGMYPSPGGCDEYIKLFLYEQDVSAEQLDSFKGKATGLMEEGEYISLKVVELDRLIEETSDAKALCAFTLYQYLQSKKQ